jgi:hypothetical protein
MLNTKREVYNFGPLAASIKFLISKQIKRALTEKYSVQAKREGYYVRLTNDPAWLVNMAINRRAGWPDDPSGAYGSAMPVNGRYPQRACDGTLRMIAREINTP